MLSDKFKFSLNRIVLFAFLIVPILLSTKLHLTNINLVFNYTFLWIASSIFYLIAIYLIRKLQLLNHQIIFLIFISIATQLSFLNYEPIGSDDIYRYMWDGKVQTNGINPYLYKPIDKELTELHSEILPSKMNFKEMRTIYFPLSQWMFYIGYNLSEEHFWGFKILIFISLTIAIFFIYKILLLLKLEIKNLLLFILSPLIYFQFSIDGHLDAIGTPLLLGSIYFYLKGNKLSSALLLGFSFSIKPIAIVLVPIFFLNEKGLTSKIQFIALSFLSFFIQFIPYISSSNPFEAFLIYSKNWMYNGFIFSSINLLVHNNQTSRIITWFVLLFILLPIYFSKIEIIKKIYFSILLMIIFSPVVHPWYLIWLLVLIPFVNVNSGLYLVSAVCLTSITIFVYKMSGSWKDYFWIQIIEFVPTLIFMSYEFYRLKYFTHDINIDEFEKKK